MQHRATNGEPFPGKTERNWPTLVTTATTASRGNDRGIRLTILQHGPLVLWISNRPASRHGTPFAQQSSCAIVREPMAIPTELDVNGLVAPAIFTLWITVFPPNSFSQDVESRFTIRDIVVTSYTVDEEQYNLNVSELLRIVRLEGSMILRSIFRPIYFLNFQYFL